MSLLLSCQSLAKSHGSRQLFKDVSFGIFRGDKIGLIGPNGAGKSTLLKILVGIENSDKGTVSYKKSVRIGYVPQTSSYTSQSVEEVVFNAISGQMNLPDYERHTQVAILLSKLGFSDPQQEAQTLSGGWKKRLDLAKELINSPDILLLDEPTNHLDLEGILWLENFLQTENIAFIITSHDRYILQNVTHKMMELNSIYPQGTYTVEGSYLEFIEKKTEFIEQQLQSEQALSQKVRNEIDWLRRSPKARTTKSTARIQSANKLIQDLDNIKTRNKQSTSKIDFESTDRQTNRLVSIKNAAKSLGGRELFSGLDITLSPGMCLGIVGPNGCGKSTLLKMIAKEIQPDIGTIKYADGIRIVYFDQYRQQLPPDATLRSALAPEGDTVIYRGSHIHVNSWAKRFLFTLDRMDLPVKQLSGGERARIQIARLMLQPADLLLLDEPTNDLDIATLETLEESLLEFPGAIVLITHDRALLDRLATSVIGLGLPGEIPILADYRQWEAYVEQKKRAVPQTTIAKNERIEKNPSSDSKKKLSYKEMKELEQMEVKITTIEGKIATLHASMQKHTESNDLTELQLTCKQLESAQHELELSFQRWQELDSKNH
ncbi:MAG: ABC-F family ATP-binding cassette domain-containing protein [Parachlamydiaceae bacterium]|nr:ABC-F family ATP-binding cassette domain-containing protein [Parachlamydiaceae bacterium]